MPVAPDDERELVAARLQEFFAGAWRAGDLVRFHTAHKLVLMSHSPVEYRQLGRLVAAAASLPRGQLQDDYTQRFMRTFAVPATRGRHTNVLQHMAGYFTNVLDPAARAELHGAIEDYRLGVVPLTVPVELIRTHTRAHDIPYLAGQWYLELWACRPRL